MHRQLKILHLSDLHLDKDHLRDQRIVLSALFKDIRQTVAGQGPYDLVFFTGDLIAKGAFNDANMQAVEKDFLLPLIEAAEIAPEQLFLVPGNHDVNLKSQSGILASAQKSLSTEEEVAKYLDEAIRAQVETGLEGFQCILGRINTTDSAVLSNTHYRAYIADIDGLKVGIGALNSAWGATGAQSDGDYGKLRISRKQLDEVAAAISSADIKIALVHHPISWLTPKDAQNTQRQFLLHFDALFHGHNHEPDAIVSVGTSNNFFTSNAGCLYQNRDYFNGYTSITYTHREKRWHIKAREYVETRQVFDLATRFGPQGEATFVRTGDASQGPMSIVPSEEYIDSVHAAFNARLLPSLVSDVAPKNLKSIFVDPLLSRVSQRKIDASTKNGSTGLFVSLKDVLQLKSNVVFLGNKDMGKTTLLHRICQLCLDFGASEMSPFGAYVNLDVAGETQAALIEAIVSFGGGAYRKSEITDLLRQGAISVCFDNLHEQRGKQFKAVRDFCQAFSKCRFYFSMLEDVDYSLSPDQVPKVTPDSEVFYLHPFGRKQTRLLTQNWFGESLEECAPKVDDILSLLGRLNIPRSPFLISALLWIREKGTQFSPVNQAEILDALVDGVMEKLSETKDRSRIDSTIKRHYLAALAEHLYRTGKKRIRTLELERFTVDYFESKGLPAATGPFLVDLKAKGILLELGDEVTFMFEAIRAFFLSTRLHESPELLNIALSKESFLELGEELDYYTGRHRDQSKVLRASIALVREFFAEASLTIELNDFDKIRVNVDPITAKSKNSLIHATSKRPDAAQRHSLLESVDEQLTTQPDLDSRSSRQHIQTGIGRYLEALRIASSILRNSELVGDLALKEEGYSEFTEGWCRILIGVTTALDGGSENQISPTVDAKREDPVLHLLQGLLPTDNPGMAKHLRRLIIPNVIVSLALESIGTAKLQKVMEAHNKSTTTTVQRVMDVFLMVDLRIPNWIHHLERLLSQHHKNRFVGELVFAKLFQIFMLGRLRKNEEDKVKGMLSESITLMLAENRGQQKSRIRGNFLSNLEKRRLVRK
jgi:predicted MPP superfamily phosphohydrolase